jgi:lipoprotein-anchoring transpeptidase ErfK/SrfK
MRHGDSAMSRLARGLAGLAAAALVLTACTSTPTSTQTVNTGHEAKARVAGAAPTTSAGPVSVDVTPASGQGISPATPIVVKATNGTLTSVTVQDTKGNAVTGALSADNETWTSNESMAYGSTYKINAVAAGRSGQSVTKQASVSTLTPSKVAYPNMIPAPATVTSSGVGVGQPVVFDFDQPVVNKQAVQAALSVRTTPSQPGAWYWISDNQVDYRAPNFWQAGTTIDVTANIVGVDFGNGIYGAEDRQVTYHVHDALIAKADGNTEQMSISDNGTVIKTMPISMGKQATPTHEGTHVISAKNQSVNMNSCTYGVCSGPNAYNVTEYWAERISNDGEFVHENPNSVGAQGSSNVSHGCINLNLQNAQWFFGHMGVGDVVEVTNSGGPPLPVWDLYGDWSVPWAQWSAGNA